MHATVQCRFGEAERLYDVAMEAYSCALAQLRRHESAQQVAVLRGMKVVGVTISGASIYNDLIEELQPRYVLVEEAAEVLEPLLIAGLGPWVQRLVMIGDHEQLRPSVECHTLSTEFHFNTSLMERLLKGSTPHVTLTAQARMMPEFAELLLDVYPSLTTSSRVFDETRVSPPPGAAKSIWFWDICLRKPVSSPSPTAPDSVTAGESLSDRSYVNEAEAVAAVSLVIHFVRSGVEPARITVIGAYMGQVKRIKALINEYIGGVFSGGWPVEDVHGAAARNQLAVLQCATDGQSWRQCVDLCETFLKLGDIEWASRALHAGTRLAKQAKVLPSDVQAATEKHEKHIKRLAAAQDVVDHFLSSGDGQGEAVDELKQLEELAVRWRTAGDIPATAAACVLISSLANTMKNAPDCNHKLRGLLHALSSSAADHLTSLESQHDVLVSTIDRYQGSENDVVIVSLVRSNTEGDVGFMRERARRVVAQSRARLGMYFVGDRNTFQTVKHWATLMNSLHVSGNIGKCIPLCCPKHCETHVKEASHALRIITDGVCPKPCSELMSCGRHRCKLRCHGDNAAHAFCKEMVDDKCADGHPLRRKCFQSAADIKCKTCTELARCAAEKEKRDREEREKEAQAECNRQVERFRRQPAGLQKRDLSKHGKDAVLYNAVVDRTEK